MTGSKNRKIQVVDTLLPLFKDENKIPLQFTKTQKKIIYAIALKLYPRVGIIAPTQYGKSTAIAVGIIIRCMLTAEKFIIVGGTKAKAGIIMRYIIEHLFDDEVITSQIVIEGGALEKLKRERNKDHITFKRGGSVRIISAENRNRKRIGEMLLGEGAKNVVLDDSVLCEDDTYAYVKRMVGGHKENFLLESSNPLRRNHFYKTMTKDKGYHKIWIDCKEALKEGRFTAEYIKEMKSEKFFDVFYECKFPGAGVMDDEGYMFLLSEEQVDAAVGPVKINKKMQGLKLGLDVAQGGNNTVYALRDSFQATIDKAVKTGGAKWIDTVCGLTIEYMRDGIRAENVSIDGTGIGSGVSSNLVGQNYAINNVVWGSAASQESKKEADDKKLPHFLNMRAECYWMLREWIIKGGKIENNENLISQLKGIKYRVNSSGKIQVQPKEQMILSTDSPDESDALASTFAPSGMFKIDSEEVPTNSAFEDMGISNRDFDEFSMSKFDKGR